MKSWFLPSADSPFLDWLGLILVLILLFVGAIVGVLWLKTLNPRPPRRKRKHRHHRTHNPTLAQSGGLPPRRDPNQPPPGP